MAKWKKTLQRMLSDSDPRNYTYDDAAGILRQLGFTVAPQSGTSHRMWRLESPTAGVVVIGLVKKGHGTLKRYLVRDMLAQLRSKSLIPAGLEDTR